MLQRFLLIALTLCSLTATAQWQQTGSKVRYVNGLGIPTKDTAAGVSADSSQILIRPADSSLYVKYKRTWMRVGGGGGSIAGGGTTNYVPKFTSSSAIGNSQIFDNGTNVGIGTASPGGRLQVLGGALTVGGVNTYALTLGNSSGNDLSFGTDGSYAYIQSWASKPLQINNQGNNTLLNITSGDVGIGTASPATTLQVGNSSGLKQISIYGGGYDLALGASGGSIFGFASQAISTVFNTALVPLGVGTNAAQPFILGTSALERMRISPGGNALINTTTDNGVDKLQVNGGMNVSTLATTNNLSVTTNATVGGTATIVGDVQINGLIGVSTTPQTYAIRLRKSGNNIIEFGTQSATNYSRFLHSSSTPFGAIGNASGAGISGGSNDDFAIGTASGSNNIIFHLNAVEKVRITSSGRILANTTTDNGVDELQVNGSISGIGMKQAYVTKTGAYTATNDDYVIDCTSGTFTVTLPASSGRTGRILIIKNSGAGTITVDGNASETIDGAATYSLATQYATVQIMSDGTNWKIIAKF